MLAAYNGNGSTKAFIITPSAPRTKVLPISPVASRPFKAGMSFDTGINNVAIFIGSAKAPTKPPVNEAAPLMNVPSLRDKRSRAAISFIFWAAITSASCFLIGLLKCTPYWAYFALASSTVNISLSSASARALFISFIRLIEPIVVSSNMCFTDSVKITPFEYGWCVAWCCSINKFVLSPSEYGVCIAPCSGLTRELSCSDFSCCNTVLKSSGIIYSSSLLSFLIFPYRQHYNKHHNMLQVYRLYQV